MLSKICSLAILLLCVVNFSTAEPTHVSIHVLSKDAKFIGSSMEGATVTIEDVDTHKILASGITKGGTGDTKLIMETAHRRNSDSYLTDSDTAVYQTTIDIKKPTKVLIQASGPNKPANSSNSVSITQWLIPGKHLNANDGIVLEIPGFAIALHDIPDRIALQEKTVEIPITARVTMMCGCPLSPNGLWDANKVEIVAELYKDEKVQQSTRLKFTKDSTFSGTLSVNTAGQYELWVYAFDANHNNTGVAKTSINITTP